MCDHDAHRPRRDSFANTSCHVSFGTPFSSPRLSRWSLLPGKVSESGNGVTEVSPIFRSSPSTADYGAAEDGRGLNDVENKMRANSTSDVVSVGIESIANGSGEYLKLPPGGALGALGDSSNYTAVHMMEQQLQVEDGFGDMMNGNGEPESAFSDDCRGEDLPSFVVLDCSKVTNVSK